MIPILTIDEALEAMHRGRSINSQWFIKDDEERNLYNEAHSRPNFFVEDGQIVWSTSKILKDPAFMDMPSLVIEGKDKWLMSKEYLELDVELFVLAKCKTDEERERAAMELSMYKERDLYHVLQWIIMIVDLMRKQDIVWGVGRGSSVASYVLYLIGIHKIDSIKYELEIEEFLR